jgi:type II secretory pathway pseudopilin PulG
MKHHKPNSRRGAAAVVLSLALLLIVTTTMVTTLRGQWAGRQAREAMQSRHTLLTAIDAAKTLPQETLAAGLRLPLNVGQGSASSEERIVFLSLIETSEGSWKIRAAEQMGDAVFSEVVRDWKESSK